MKLTLCLSFLLTIAGCSTGRLSGDSEYLSLVEAETRKSSQYDGFHQTFQTTVTRLTQELVTAGLARRAQKQLWDAAKLQTERDRAFQEMASTTKFFVRLYTPEHQLNDMHQPTTAWKTYLEYEGKRYEGKVRKLTEKLVELKLLYPYVDRFSNYYEVSFNVPTSSTTASPVQFILTGPMGLAEFSYPPR